MHISTWQKSARARSRASCIPAVLCVSDCAWTNAMLSASSSRVGSRAFCVGSNYIWQRRLLGGNELQACRRADGNRKSQACDVCEADDSQHFFTHMASLSVIKIA